MGGLPFGRLGGAPGDRREAAWQWAGVVAALWWAGGSCGSDYGAGMGNDGGERNKLLRDNMRTKKVAQLIL